MRVIATGLIGLACTASDPSMPAKPAAGAIVGISDMTVARAAHTATLLRDRRVLLVGGLDAAAGTAELFDPTTRAFARTGPLSARRVGHTATLLSDGRVLIAGGYNGSYLASTEIYDPAQGTFSAGPSMTAPRSDHLAITLRDGRTLIIGGQGGESLFLATAEIFDPTTSRFTPTGAMAVPRASHIAGLLPDGSVIVAGGHSGRHQSIELYASAERYDPVRGLFSTAGTMTRRRHKHSGVVLSNGQLLITGGSDERDDRGMYRDAEAYDPSSGRFRNVGDMQQGRYKHAGAMTLLRDGKVLIAGGADDGELFDPATGSFTLVPTSPKLAGSFSTVTQLLDGSVLIAGGYGTGVAARANAWMFVPASR